MLTNDYCVIINQGFNLNVTATFRDYLTKFGACDSLFPITSPYYSFRITLSLRLLG